jgi:uncharacterized membrane protein
MGSLPDIHPFLVHFPIALFTTGVIADMALIARLRIPWLDRAVLLLFVASALSSLAAAWAGKLAADRVTPALDETRAAAVANHGDWAFATVVLIFLAVIVRFEALWRDRGTGTARLTSARLLAFPLALAAEGCLLATADRGGALLYHHGIGMIVR